jgi:hypothetical protein
MAFVRLAKYSFEFKCRNLLIKNINFIAWQVAQRVCAAMFEVALSMKLFSAAARHVFVFELKFKKCRMVHNFSWYLRAKKLNSAIKQQAWEDDACRVLRQLNGVGEVISQKLIKNGLTIKDLQTRSASQIDYVLGKQNSSFGSSLLGELSDVPVLTLAIKPALLVAGKLSKVQVHEYTFDNDNIDTPVIKLHTVFFSLNR